MIQENEIFLNKDDFAEEVELHSSNTIRQVVCIFNEEGTLMNIGENQVVTINPYCDIKLEDADGIKQNDIIIRNNKTYYINYVLDLGDGFARLILSRDAT